MVLPDEPTHLQSLRLLLPLVGTACRANQREDFAKLRRRGTSYSPFWLSGALVGCTVR
jgi:hypothetical protein